MKTPIESLARLTSLVRKGTLTVAVATLTLGTPVYAATIATPFMFTASDTTDLLRCAAVNVGDSPVANVKVELVQFGGSVAKTAVCSDPLPPSFFCLTNTLGAGSFGEAVYCRVSFKGSKQNMRAALEVIDSRSNTKVALPAD
jgi:hypothetical protein